MGIAGLTSIIDSTPANGVQQAADHGVTSETTEVGLAILADTAVGTDDYEHMLALYNSVLSSVAAPGHKTTHILSRHFYEYGLTARKFSVSVGRMTSRVRKESGDAALGDGVAVGKSNSLSHSSVDSDDDVQAKLLSLYPDAVVTAKSLKFVGEADIAIVKMVWNATVAGALADFPKQTSVIVMTPDSDVIALLACLTNVSPAFRAFQHRVLIYHHASNISANQSSRSSRLLLLSDIITALDSQNKLSPETLFLNSELYNPKYVSHDGHLSRREAVDAVMRLVNDLSRPHRSAILAYMQKCAETASTDAQIFDQYVAYITTPIEFSSITMWECTCQPMLPLDVVDECIANLGIAPPSMSLATCNDLFRERFGFNVATGCHSHSVTFRFEEGYTINLGSNSLIVPRPTEAILHLHSSPDAYVEQEPTQASSLLLPVPAPSQPPQPDAVRGARSFIAHRSDMADFMTHLMTIPNASMLGMSVVKVPGGFEMSEDTYNVALALIRTPTLLDPSWYLKRAENFNVAIRAYRAQLDPEEMRTPGESNRDARNADRAEASQSQLPADVS